MDSKLQIISGRFRGYKLNLPSNARPTQNRARLAIFNMLNVFLNPADKIIVWDAFGGSGAMGLEILSRYDNSTVVFTDISDVAIKTITKNVSGTRISPNRYKIENENAVQKTKKYGPTANLIFVDPPYDNPDTGISFVRKLANSVAVDTIVVQEVEALVAYSPDTKFWNVLRDKTYGRARFLILQRKSDK